MQNDLDMMPESGFLTRNVQLLMDCPDLVLSRIVQEEQSLLEKFSFVSRSVFGYQIYVVCITLPFDRHCFPTSILKICLQN